MSLNSSCSGWKKIAVAIGSFTTPSRGVSTLYLHTTFAYNLTTLWTYAGTYPRLEHSLTERDNGDGRLIRDRAGEIKPFGFEFCMV